MNAATGVDLTRLLAPTRKEPLWEANKSGWRCFVMGNDRCHYRRRSKLRTAWQSGYDAASRSADPVGGML
ncbi:hypothetical protein FHT00_002986 [Sphingomonas insulae]|uniref:Uncharacterized protein n=1 Tax=Sphingomonas insulae TaxID=424800 RepID=A0ABN1HZH1_9SPHN|nr:hypothetical protein [Sphingomonas insulae]NIJ31007.1 hypothetical protein [Sphingomonas insulae]